MKRVVKTYRNLSSEKIIETLAVLGERINQRFPNSGLYLVCEELVQIAKHTSARAEAIARPVLWLRLLLAAVAVASAFAVYLLLAWAIHLRSSDELAGVLQGLEATVNLVIIAGGAALFLTTLETRLKRSLALTALHEFRSIAHVIDMHQLTKDPSALGGPRTSSSPERDMTRYELVRYLGYCSEMLSLSSKAAAVYAEKIHDPAVIDAVGDIETLSTNLSQKIWQKITLVETDIEDARGAAAVSAGELSQLPPPSGQMMTPHSIDLGRRITDERLASAAGYAEMASGSIFVRIRRPHRQVVGGRRCCSTAASIIGTRRGAAQTSSTSTGQDRTRRVWPDNRRWRW